MWDSVVQPGKPPLGPKTLSCEKAPRTGNSNIRLDLESSEVCPLKQTYCLVSYTQLNLLSYQTDFQIWYYMSKNIESD